LKLGRRRDELGFVFGPLRRGVGVLGLAFRRAQSIPLAGHSKGDGGGEEQEGDV
jgi:hypothetical protein